MDNWLFKRIDNTGLCLWRIAFGFLITVEAFGAMATGWVKRVLVEPEFTFNFIGFEFLQPLPGNGMYFYFTLMGCFGFLVMIGYRYRWAMAAYALMWTSVYLMQKSAYNNHYYLMMLLCWIMVFLPANRSLSMDAKKESFRKNSMPQWVKTFFIANLWIVFTYAAVAKIYPHWLDTTVAELFMKGKKDFWLIGDFLQLTWVHYSITYFGILFDLLIIPMLLWKPTRLFGFYLSLFFHLFNSAVFHIGIFPYMSIAFALFFFTPETLKKRFKLKRKVYTGGDIISLPKWKNIGIAIVGVYCIVQIALPLRHWFYEDDVLWTEEGHRLSWRMMLRTRSGTALYWVVNKETQERKNYPYKNLVSKKQLRNVRSKPDFIWQMAQRIKEIEAEKGNDVEVYVSSRVKINGGEYFQLIDPEVDLAAEPWQHFKHHDWILTSPEDYFKKPK